jgi:hypothetical protein
VKKVKPLLENEHKLLVTLLLCNAFSMEALPLCLDQFLDPATAILVSVSAVLLFGEVIPQAVRPKNYSETFVNIFKHFKHSQTISNILKHFNHARTCAPPHTQYPH